MQKIQLEWKTIPERLLERDSLIPACQSEQIIMVDLDMIPWPQVHSVRSL